VYVQAADLLDASRDRRRAPKPGGFRSKVEALIIRYIAKTLPGITVSIGVAAFPEAGDNPERC
jgi:hypothetical protein